MSKKTDKLIKLLSPYGLNDDEVRVYLELLEKGRSSVVEIHRSTGISRTKVYRLLDSLEQKGLVVVLLHSRGKRFEASHPKKLNMLVDQKESEVEKLKSDLPIVMNALKRINGQTKEEAKVLYYEGLEGLKQVTYNSLKAKKELLTLEITDMDGFFDHEYAEKMRHKFIDREIQIKTLTNQKEIPEWTETATEMVRKYWQIRHLPEEQLEIKFEILVYNNVYAMYRYQGGKIFCVEVYSNELAEMQKQLFSYMWDKAEKFKIINEFGKAELVN
jgi:predicted transcriptional regulator